MLTPEQNRMIAEVLGLCWHDNDAQDWLIKNNKKLCEKCNKWVEINIDERYSFKDNISYSTWEGFRIIMENGPKQEWWNCFVTDSMDVFHCQWVGYDPKLSWSIYPDYIGPAFAIELTRFLEGRKK